MDDDKRAAYDTLYTSLRTTALVAAPVLPFVAEAIYRGLGGEDSVHLADWPDAAALPRDEDLVHAMDRVREVCSTGRTLREREALRVRQPLASLTIAGAGVSALAPFRDLIAEEVNVKEVILSEDIDAHAEMTLQVNARVAGPRLGGAMKGVLAAAKRGEWEPGAPGEGIRVGGERLEAAEYELRLRPREGAPCEALPSQDAVVLLDTQLSDALIAEGFARDIVRGVQQARKDAGLHVSDRIHLVLALPEGPQGWRDAATDFGDWIAEQTLAERLEMADRIDEQRFSTHAARFGESEIQIGLAALRD